MGRLSLTVVDLSKNQLNRILKRGATKVIREKFEALRPGVKLAIDEGVNNVKDEFIPDISHVKELGIGSGGSPDLNRIDNAWRYLLVDKGATTFSIKSINRGQFIGSIKVNVKEESFFRARLSRVPTLDSTDIAEIPWMRWLIMGAPSISGFEFTEKGGRGARKSGRGGSRTGLGRMTKGSVWRFPPARPAAFQNLMDSIEENVVQFLKNNIDELLEG